MKKIKSKKVRDYVMNDMVRKVDLPSFLKEIAECSKSIVRITHLSKIGCMIV